MRAKVARALRKEALSTAPPPSERVDGIDPKNHLRGWDTHGNAWGQKRTTAYKLLKRAATYGNSGQSPKFEKERKRRAGQPHTCLDVGRNPVDGTRRTWKEGEALIVESPLRAIARLVDIDDLNRLRAKYGVGPASPKWWLDWTAQGGLSVPAAGESASGNLKDAALASRARVAAARLRDMTEADFDEALELEAQR